MTTIMTSGASSVLAPASASAPFDIVQTYKDILAADPEITMPMAAIEALIALLGATPSSTAMETVETVQRQASVLLRAFPNPVPLRAGTDMFQQTLLRSLRGQSFSVSAVASAAPPSSHGNNNSNYRPAYHRVPGFDEIRDHLLSNNRRFAAEAKAARDVIAENGSRLIRRGAVILAAGGSRTVRKLLARAAAHARAGAGGFRVLYVLDGSPAAKAAAESLRSESAGLVDVTEVSESGVAHALASERVDLALVGTEALCGNGGLLSRRGTFQLAELCRRRRSRVPFYVAAETHKIVRGFPLGPAFLDRFGVTDENVDYTPPELVDYVITEQGIKRPAKIFDYIIELYL